MNEEEEKAVRALQDQLDRFIAYVYIVDRYGENGHHDEQLTQEDWDLVSDWGQHNDPPDSYTSQSVSYEEDEE